MILLFMLGVAKITSLNVIRMKESKTYKYFLPGKLPNLSYFSHKSKDFLYHCFLYKKKTQTHPKRKKKLISAFNT